MARFAAKLVAAATVGSVVIAGGADDAVARSARGIPPGPVRLFDVGSPEGLQGLAGAGARVVLPFRLVSPRGVATDVQVQYAVDRNADGTLSEDEYRPATEDRLDPQDTRANRRPQLFDASADPGTSHAFVWY